MPNPLTRPLLRFAGNLRFPQLFAVLLVVFLVDLVLPDPVPFVDEILLGLATVALGNWRRRTPPEHP